MHSHPQHSLAELTFGAIFEFATLTQGDGVADGVTLAFGC
jgi:hypothetical protein